MTPSIIDRLVAFFEGDPAVRKVAQDPSVTAELLLLFRVALADGKVEQAEMDMLKRIAEEAFGIGPESFPDVVRYLHEFGYETTGKQAAEVFRSMSYERKKALVEHMEAIARSDHSLDEREAGLLAEADFAAVDEDVAALIERAVTEAKAAKVPAVSTLADHVYTSY